MKKHFPDDSLLIRKPFPASVMMYGNRNRTTALAGLTFAFLAAIAPAAILTSYDFTGGSQTSSVSPSNVTTSLFTAGPGLTVRNDGTGAVTGNAGYDLGYARVSAAYVVGAGTAAGTEATSVSLDEFYSFKIGTSSGYLLNLQQIAFRTSYHALSGSNVIASFFLRSSLDGFASNIGSVIDQEMEDTSSVFQSRTISLDTPAFQNVGSEIEFRIYLYDNNNSASRWLALDDVSITGDVIAAPEPSTMLLLSAGSLLLARRTRRTAPHR